MLVARVVRHQVQQDPDPPAARVGHQAVEVVQGPEVGMDGTEVRDVVAPVRVGRRGDGREPEAVDAEPLEMVEMRDEAGKVADAVAVGIGEGPRVDLVEHRGLPPRPVGLGGGVGSQPPGLGATGGRG